MKKLLTVAFVILLAASCSKEKIYKENLKGTWQVYKYLLRNTDKTTLFQNTFPGYTISFTDNGNFTEIYTAPDTSVINGTYSFTDNDEKILLEHTYLNVTDSTTKTMKRPYTIFNLTRDHVQLRNDTSQLYLKKLPE